MLKKMSELDGPRKGRKDRRGETIYIDHGRVGFVSVCEKAHIVNRILILTVVDRALLVHGTLKAFNSHRQKLAFASHA